MNSQKTGGSRRIASIFIPVAVIGAGICILGQQFVNGSFEATSAPAGTARVAYEWSTPAVKTDSNDATVDVSNWQATSGCHYVPH